MSQDKIIALLPMKAHSERVPHKNIRAFNGKPLYFWMIESLLQSESIKEVIINTDIKSIGEEVKYFSKGVKVIDRPENLCGDYVSVNALIAHDMGQTDGEYFLQTHSTNPLLTTATINKAIQQYFGSIEKYDSLFGVTRLKKRFYWSDGRAINHDPKDQLVRTQDLQPVYEENSCIYIFSRESFRNAHNHRIGLRPQMFEIDHIEAVDIDEESDFILAETLHKLRYDKSKK